MKSGVIFSIFSCICIAVALSACGENDSTSETKDDAVYPEQTESSQFSASAVNAGTVADSPSGSASQPSEILTSTPSSPETSTIVGGDVQTGTLAPTEGGPQSPTIASSNEQTANSSEMGAATGGWFYIMGSPTGFTRIGPFRSKYECEQARIADFNRSAYFVAGECVPGS